MFAPSLFYLTHRLDLIRCLSRYSFFYLPRKQTSFVGYLLYHKRVSIKTIFYCLLNNMFSLFFELLPNLATHITWPSEEDPAELCPHPSWIFQIQRGHGKIWQSKQPEANVVVTNTIATTCTVTSSHTTLGSVTSIGPHLSGATTRVKVDLGAMAMKGYSAFPKSPRSLAIILFNVISRTLVKGVVLDCRDVVGVFYSPTWLSFLK